jgi:hypothetical protein
MKKKFLIGVLSLASLITLSSFGEENSDSSTERRFWGSTVTSNGDCSPTGEIQADGTPKCACPVLVTYYVLWVGVSEHEEVRYTAC